MCWYARLDHFGALADLTPSDHSHPNGNVAGPAIISGMSASERLDINSFEQTNYHRRFVELRRSVHRTMKAEEAKRLKDNPSPTEEELYMGAFKEWLEPQVRAAISAMYRKGYATQSSGFHGGNPEMQTIDGHFIIDKLTKEVLRRMGVDVLRGQDIGVPKNTLITILRFRATNPSVDSLKVKWDAVAAVLPQRSLPDGIRPICDRAEEFRAQYAPDHPSLDEARDNYHEYLRNSAG
jgi:hypothetical protein